jgi:hypothetical protein
LNGPPIYLKLPPVAGVSGVVAALMSTLALAAAPVTDAALRTEVDRLVAELAAARHLPFSGALAARTITRETADRERAVAIGVGVEAGLPGPGVGVEARLLERLGLVPTDAEYGTLVARTTLTATPTASYDPGHGTPMGTLSVPDFIPLPEQRVALTHQIAHALADRRFGLRKFLKLGAQGERGLDGDAARARLAVVEGDATLSAFELQDPHEGFLGPREMTSLATRLRGATATAETPGWLRDLAVFTHVDGWTFVAGARARGPWSAVDALWTDPPASTEQVLHPEKYEACEAPIPVDEAALPDLPGFGRPVASDVAGELMVRSWLASALPSEIAARAAAGWGGDRAGIYTAQPGAVSDIRLAPDAGVASDAGLTPEHPLVWLTVWDDDGEADDFARAARQVLAAQTHAAPVSIDPVPPPADGRKKSAPRAALASEGHTLFPTANGLYGLERRGDAVALLFGAPAPSAPALGQMLDGWQRRQAVNRRAANRPRRAAQPGCPRRDRAAGRG